MLLCRDTVTIPGDAIRCSWRGAYASAVIGVCDGLFGRCVGFVGLAVRLLGELACKRFAIAGYLYPRGYCWPQRAFARGRHRTKRLSARRCGGDDKRSPLGQNIVRVARWHIGTRYGARRRGVAGLTDQKTAPAPRSSSSRNSARSCPITRSASGGEARKIAKSNLRPGDLVFFKEAGRSRPITHVGIYSGSGNLVHASNFFGKVVESKMKYMRGYYRREEDTIEIGATR